MAKRYVHGPELFRYMNTVESAYTPGLRFEYTYAFMTDGKVLKRSRTVSEDGTKSASEWKLAKVKPELKDSKVLEQHLKDKGWARETAQ